MSSSGVFPDCSKSEACFHHHILPNRYPIEREKQKALKRTAIKQMALLRCRDKNYGRRASTQACDIPETPPVSPVKRPSRVLRHERAVKRLRTLVPACELYTV